MFIWIKYALGTLRWSETAVRDGQQTKVTERNQERRTSGETAGTEMKRPRVGESRPILLIYGGRIRRLTAAIIDGDDKKLVLKITAEKYHLFQEKDDILEELILQGTTFDKWYAVVQLKSENVLLTPSFLWITSFGHESSDSARLIARVEYLSIPIESRIN